MQTLLNIYSYKDYSTYNHQTALSPFLTNFHQLFIHLRTESSALLPHFENLKLSANISHVCKNYQLLLNRQMKILVSPSNFKSIIIVAITSTARHWTSTMLTISSGFNAADSWLTRLVYYIVTVTVFISYSWQLLQSSQLDKLQHPVTCETVYLTYQHTHNTQSFYCSSGFCPGLPGWAGTRKVKPGR